MVEIPGDARIVCKFSCGVTSAVATKLALNAYGVAHDVVIHNAIVQEEHPDNARFLRDCERWFGQSIQRFADTRYGASTLQLFRKRRYLKGARGAPCSKTLKREVLDAQALPNDVVVLGYDAAEQDRLDNWIDANPDRRVIAPLIDAGVTKSDALALIERAGLVLPEMYRLGYHNANCIGCVKGGAGYWNKIRRDFPGRFEEVAQIEEMLGPGAYLLRHRSGPLKGRRFPLRELDPNTGSYKDEPSIECGSSCEYVEALPGWDLEQEQLW
jgi:hypothetical protein